MLKFDTIVANDGGEFYVPETKCWFTFKPNTDDAWGLSHDLIHKIDVLDGYRCGIVRQGVAYVAVDEDSGRPVLERWTITKRKLFTHAAS